MNVVIFGKGLGRARQLNLSGLKATGFVAVCVAVLGACGFAVGYWYSSLTGSGVSMHEVAQLTGEIEQQRADIETIRQENEDTLDALAIRLAQINARVIRLDALGRRLTDMADLDDGEFDFDSEPALGGPEEPLMNGSNVPVPEIVETMQALDYQLSDREAQLSVLESVLMGQNLNERVYPQGRPVNSGWISSYFGRRTDPFTGKPANHTGIDFAGKLGDKVLAVGYLVGRSLRLWRHGRTQSRQRVLDPLCAQLGKSRRGGGRGQERPTRCADGRDGSSYRS